MQPQRASLELHVCPSLVHTVGSRGTRFDKNRSLCTSRPFNWNTCNCALSKYYKYCFHFGKTTTEKWRIYDLLAINIISLFGRLHLKSSTGHKWHHSFSTPELETVDSAVWNSPRCASLAHDCLGQSLLELRLSQRTLFPSDFRWHYIQQKAHFFFKPKTNKDMSQLSLDRRHKVEVNSIRQHQGKQTPRLPFHTIALHIFSPHNSLFWIFSP